MNRKIIGSVCSKAGKILTKKHSIQVTHSAVDDGQQAVDAVTAGPSFDVILMDKDMPVMDGLEATRRIRALEASEGRPRAYICFVSASAFPEDNEAAIQAGCDKILPKPVNIPALVKVMESLPLHPASTASQKPLAGRETDTLVQIDEPPPP